jgi:hypothetical protein
MNYLMNASHSAPILFITSNVTPYTYNILPMLGLHAFKNSTKISTLLCVSPTKLNYIKQYI